MAAERHKSSGFDYLTDSGQDIEDSGQHLLSIRGKSGQRSRNWGKGQTYPTILHIITLSSMLLCLCRGLFSPPIPAASRLSSVLRPSAFEPSLGIGGRGDP